MKKQPLVSKPIQHSLSKLLEKERQRSLSKSQCMYHQVRTINQGKILSQQWQRTGKRKHPTFCAIAIKKNVTTKTKTLPNLPVKV
jgi:hypothetical protein